MEDILFYALGAFMFGTYSVAMVLIIAAVIEHFFPKR